MKLLRWDGCFTVALGSISYLFTVVYLQIGRGRGLGVGVGTLSLESRFLVRASRRNFWFIMQNSWWFSFHKKVSLSKHIHAQIQQQKQWKKVWNSLKLTIRTPEQYFEPISSASVINSEDISHSFLVFVLLNLNK